MPKAWTPTQLRTLRQGADAGNQGDAPRSVIEAYGSLLGPDVEPLGVVCSAESQNQRVVWRIVAVTKSTVIYVEASRRATVWAERYGDERPVESLTAWAKPLRAVSKVSVVSTTSFQERFNQNEWRWRTQYEVEIGDMTIPLPLAGTAAADVGDRADKFVEELIRLI